MTILLAEDDPVTREAVTELLEGDGHRVIAEKNGMDAIDSWKSHRPDLVLLDIMMPEASGYEVCRAIRRDDRQVPIIFLSAKSEEIDVVLGLELGADDFLRKEANLNAMLTDDYRKLLDAKDIDAVVVTVPEWPNKRMIARPIRNGGVMIGSTDSDRSAPL